MQQPGSAQSTQRGHGSATSRGEAKDHAQGFGQSRGFGTAATRGLLQAHLVERAFVQQRRDHGVGLALGIGQALRQRIARRACGPEDGLQDAQVFSAAVTPAGGWQGLSPVIVVQHLMGVGA